ncbi:MAG TPA: site-specific integrase [Nitrospiraceae bacterium]|nr:site-specific integrase [Nitrospiraceae bacterium]
MARAGGRDRGICQRKDRPGWWVRVYLHGRQRWFRCDTKSQAKALYGRLKAEHREGKFFDKPQAVPFREIAQDYLQAVDARRRRRGDDFARMNRWVSAFGDQDAATISPRQIEQVLAQLQLQGKQPATLVRHLTVLKAALNRAMRLGVLKQNPAVRVKAPKPNNVLVRYLTDDQETRLLHHLPPHYQAVVLCALNTGLRQGELLRLTWADVDWNVGVLTVNETKSGERRRVPMNSTVVGTLSEVKAARTPHPQDRIFPQTARCVRRAFERAVQAARLAPFRFHDLRHTFASRLAMQGANDRTLMALGGWKSPAMLSRYAHLSPTHLYQAVEGLTRLGTVTKTVTKRPANEEKTQKLLEDMVSRLGLEPRALALKDRSNRIYQWLDFAKVSPFFWQNQRFSWFLLIRWDYNSSSLCAHF